MNKGNHQIDLKVTNKGRQYIRFNSLLNGRMHHGPTAILQLQTDESLSSSLTILELLKSVLIGE